MNIIEQKAKKIKCLICDVDGVMTDGALYYDAFGNQLKVFNVLDGVGLKLLMVADIEVAIITGAVTPVIDHRFNDLKIKHYYKGQVNKQTAYAHLKETLQYPDDVFAYIGDDFPDIPVMQQVGLSIAVPNAIGSVKAIADMQTQLRGGYGSVREVCDFILTAQNKLNRAIDHYLTA